LAWPSIKSSKNRFPALLNGFDFHYTFFVKHLWHQLFYPHENNNYRASLIQTPFIALFIVLYLLNQSFIKSLTIIKPGVLGYSSEITVQKVYDDTNLERQKTGLPALHFSSVLSQSATAKAEDMFANNYWAHNSPQGKTPWDFFKAAGYQYSIAGENLAKDFYDTDSMMAAWMNSPTHKANILNSQYQEIGIGVVNGVLDGVKTTLVVQHFGTPLNVAEINTATPEEKSYLANAQVLSDTNYQSQPTISPLQISQAVGAAMFIIIIGVLLVDGYLTLKNKTQRLTGSTAGHVGFLVIILFLLFFTRQGTIF
jgi:hypothetical protein